jgi:tetratricopeptide (TPR) repeat protein
MHMLASEHDLAIEWGERALALAERLGDVEIRAHTLNNLGSTYCGQGELEAGLALLRESLDVSLEADMRSPITRAYFNIGCFLRAAGRYEQAYENAQAHREYAVRNSVHLSDAMANQAMATVEWYWGRWGEALDRIPAISAGVAGIFNVWAHTFYGWMDNDLGRASNARQDLERLLPLAISSGEIQTTVPYLGQLARAYALLGRDEDAARTIGQILDLIDATPFYHEDSAPALLLCGRWYAARGDPASIEACRASVDRLRKAYDQLQFPETQALFEEARGHLALAEGRVADAVDHFESAAEIWESLERPYDRARTLGDLGHAQLAAADPTAAAEAYDQALDLLGELEQQLDDELGAAFHDAQMVREIRQARASL